MAKVGPLNTRLKIRSDLCRLVSLLVLTEVQASSRRDF